MTSEIATVLPIRKRELRTKGIFRNGRMIVHTQYLLKHLTTFGVDAEAQHFAEVVTHDELRTALHLPGEKLFIGGGSNILFTRHYPGTVVKIGLQGMRIEREDDSFAYVRVAAGENWHAFVQYAVERDLGGIENLSLIPGTVGAAPIQNIGAYGTEIRDVLEEVEYMHTGDGTVAVLNNEECGFGYRTSVFKRELRGRVVITSILVRLAKHPRPNLSYPALAQVVAHIPAHQLTVRDVSEAVCAVRRSKLPDPAEIGNAGSFFKNPEVPHDVVLQLQQNYPAMPVYPTRAGFAKIPAGWLIEQCGWKGRRMGNAGTYPKQALVIVNYGGASGTEILAVAQAVQADVRERFGIDLEPEVNIL